MNLRISFFGILFVVASVAFAQTKLEKAMSFIVEPYLQQVNDDSFHVLWETSLSGTGLIKYGEAEFNVLQPNLSQLVKESNQTNFHQLVVTGLKVDGYYFYQALTIGTNGDTLKGPVTPLHIPDYSQTPVDFTVVGDTQGHPLIWGRIASLMKRERPLFVVHVGDLVQYGPNKDDWTDEFLKPAAELFRFCPFYSAIGNHEMNNANYYQYVDLPGDECFYTVKKGDALFVFVNTNKDVLPGSDQYKKLQHILSSATEKWKIVAHHHPVYTSDEKGFGNTWFQRQTTGDPNHMHLRCLYEMYGVDVVLNGHIHMYERTWPIAAEHVDFENGVHYITVGGGGGGLDQAGANRNWYTAKTRGVHSFLNVSVAGDHFFAEAIDTSGVAFDTWTIDKKPGYKRLNAPEITENKQYFIDTTTVRIENQNASGRLFYSVGNESFIEPDSKTVAKTIAESAKVRAFVKDGDLKTQIAEKDFVKLSVFPAIKKVEKGVKAVYLEGEWINLPDFKKLKPVRSFNLDSVSLQLIQPRVQDHFAVRFTGSFSVPATDVYRFWLESYDGSRFFIDGKEIINNDGVHYEINMENFVALQKGNHQFEVQYFDFLRRETLNLLIGTSSAKMMNFNDFVLKR